MCHDRRTESAAQILRRDGLRSQLTLILTADPFGVIAIGKRKRQQSVVTVRKLYKKSLRNKTKNNKTLDCCVDDYHKTRLYPTGRPSNSQVADTRLPSRTTARNILPRYCSLGPQVDQLILLSRLTRLAGRVTDAKLVSYSPKHTLLV